MADRRLEESVKADRGECSLGAEDREQNQGVDLSSPWFEVFTLVTCGQIDVRKLLVLMVIPLNSACSGILCGTGCGPLRGICTWLAAQRHIHYIGRRRQGEGTP